MKEQIKRVYDELAQEYYDLRKGDSKVQFYKEMIETPALLRIVGHVKHKKVLDLGCGPGVHAKALTENGARVVGIDNSKASLEIAKKESPKSEFVLGDVENLHRFKSGEFDVVLSAMVLGHFNDWNKIFEGARRVLRKNGHFVFSIHNPFKEVMVKRKCGRREFKVSENYFHERRIYGVWAAKNKKHNISHHHKTYSTIVKYIVHNSFEIVDYDDCKPLPKAKQKYPERYKETIDMPNFCVWKLRKK